MMNEENKIVDLNDFPRLKESIEGKKTILAGGCFDVLHFGHIEFLKKAKSEGDLLLIALESDEFIEKNKKRNPIHNQDERAYILSSIRYVDIVVKIPYFDDPQSYDDLVKTINPSIIATSEGDPQYENKRKQAQAIGGEVKVVCPLIKDFSSSRIINNHATVPGN